MSSTRHSFAQFGCAAFADNARTTAYHQWACENDLYPADACLIELNDCSCALDDPLSPFTDPATDLAPWYDPNDPASAEFLGAMILSVGGIRDSTIERDPVKAFGDGTILNRARLAGRSLVFELVLLHTSVRGGEYGFEWLRRVLETDLCGCGPEPCEGCYGKRLILRRFCDDPTPCDTGLRTYESVGVIDGVKQVSDPKDECACVLTTVNFTLQSEQPYSYGCEEVVCNRTAVADFFDVCFDWTASCDDCCDDDGYRKECDRCLTDQLCTCFGNDDPVPVSLVAEDTCYCEPIVRRVQACCIDDVGAAGFDTALKFELFSGLNTTEDIDIIDIGDDEIPMDGLAFTDLGLRNLRISIFDNPDSLPCIEDADSYEAFCSTHPKPRFELQIPYIPSNANLTIDGRSNRVFMECDGVCRPFPYSLDSMKGALFPLVTNCQPMMMVIEWDLMNTQIASGPSKIPSAFTGTTFRRWRS